MSKKKQFFELLEPIYERLERFALNLTRNRSVAKDLVGETIMAAYEGFGKLNNENAMLSFLFTICTRKYYEILRQNGRLQTVEPETFDRLYSTEASPEVIADISILHDTIAELPDNLREILLMYEIAGLKYREIAEIRNISVDNVKISLHRARKQLHELLGITNRKH
ncbi:MAG: RNA polymerase sigma factor [Candidatus Kapaibacterium sp.]